MKKEIKNINDNIDEVLLDFNKKFEVVLSKIRKDLPLLAEIKNPLVFNIELSKILTKSGYYSLIKSFVSKGYDTNYKTIEALFKAGRLTLTYSAKDKVLLTALKKIHLKSFTLLGDGMVNEMSKNMMYYSLTDITKEEITSNLLSSLENTNLQKYMKTYTQTAIGNYNQAIIDIKSKDVAGEVYIYVGVDDKKTRDFCECVLDSKKYYDKANSLKLKSDPKRKYNCRHQIVPVSLEYAKDTGYIAGVFKC